MNADTLIDALDLPPNSAVGTRIAKDLVSRKGAASPADSRLIQDGTERLTWVAQVKPESAGIGPAPEPDSLASEVSIAQLESRVSGAKLDRLIEIIHRAIPYPVLLVVQDGSVAAISSARKRHSEADAEAVVLVAPPVTASIHDADLQLLEDVCRALPTGMKRVSDLGEVYDRWAAVVVGARAFGITANFDVPDQSEVWHRWDQVREWERLAAEIAAVEAQAERVTQMSDRVELNGKLQKLRVQQRQALEPV